jgi:hypothetical protein
MKAAFVALAVCTLAVCGCDRNRLKKSKFTANELALSEQMFQHTEKPDTAISQVAKSIDDFVRLSGGAEALAAVTDMAARNKVQDRLILESNSLCEDYKTTLKSKQAYINFFAGSAAVLFGAAGAVAKGAQAAKNLSALSGLSSGLKAEYNEDFYSSLTAQVIANGIDARRRDILEKIGSAKSEEVTDYSVEMAIADAITYHGACSLVGGLEQAGATLVKYELNAGLDALGANPVYKKKFDAEQKANK